MTAPDGKIFRYVYDATGRLSTVTYPDSKTRSFFYENASFPEALTGINDENGTRWGTFGYDSQGRAITSELAGGVDRVEAGYPAANNSTLKDALGTLRNYSYATMAGKLAVTGGDLPSGIGESDAASRLQDASGLITSETDFKGFQTTTTWDAVRRLPLTVTRAVGTSEAQTVTTQWHATFALPVLITESGRSTAYTYDTQGNLLSRSVSGAGGTSGATRTWQWTYTSLGLVATATEPNGAVTTYTHDTLGNVLTATNALGHVTAYAYDNANRLTSQTEPNGLVSTYTWDMRDRLLTQTVGAGIAGAQVTTFTYNPTGTLANMALPTGQVVSYSYDAAHRLVGWSDNRGDSAVSTLDAMGNRVNEQISTGSAVVYNSARTINNINRVSGQSEGSTQSLTHAYDANGERIGTTNALNESTAWGLDSLRRVQTISNAASATASLGYNALDDVTSASDFKGVATTYARDAQGNATAEATPDAGNRTATYDGLGLPSQIVDALGQATTIARDALGRPTEITLGDSKKIFLTWDVAGAGQGYLRQIEDTAGTTLYTRDAFGRVLGKTQTLINGYVRSVAYSYTTGGDLAQITYPGGAALAYVRDATGRLMQMNWNGQTLLSGITWNALGQPTGWTWHLAGSAGPIGPVAQRSYDTAARLTATEFSAYQYDAAGRLSGLTQNLFKPATTNPADASIDSHAVTWGATYDAVGRLTALNRTGTGAGSEQFSFGYDANGNRTTSSASRGAATATTRTYQIASGTNRVQGFTQAQGGASTSVSHQLNANGDLVSDGLRSYGYDSANRLASVTTGLGEDAPTTRYAHNALGQRVFKTDPLFAPVQGENAGLMASFWSFISQMWNPTVSGNQAEELGFAYVYDEDGSLIGEWGMGGASSSTSAQYIYLPTASGPMPVAVQIASSLYAVHSDHLNTPRRLTDASGQSVWQWGYSSFGEVAPTTLATRFADETTIPTTGRTGTTPITFNLRYPGQYFDAESGLHYNYFRSYDPKTGRYTQNDPIGLEGGWNRFGYVSANPLLHVDPYGLAEYKGLGAITFHLERLSRAQGDDFGKVYWTSAERAMLERLRQGHDTPWDIGFYHHEMAEAHMCRPYVRRSDKVFLEQQKKAHDEVERNQQNTLWDRYHPDVIRRFPDLFPPRK